MSESSQVKQVNLNRTGKMFEMKGMDQETFSVCNFFEFLKLLLFVDISKDKLCMDVCV